jgi:hypothetical protein
LDSKCGTGLFIKVNTKTPIRQETIVSFCATHMIIQLDSSSTLPSLSLDNKVIKIKFLQGPHMNQEYVYNANTKQVVRIGRSRNAEIPYRDDSVSRIQCV